MYPASSSESANPALGLVTDVRPHNAPGTICVELCTAVSTAHEMVPVVELVLTYVGVADSRVSSVSMHFLQPIGVSAIGATVYVGVVTEPPKRPVPVSGAVNPNTPCELHPVA